MNRHPQAKIIKLQPKGTLLGWIARNNYSLWFIAICLCWLLAARTWCNNHQLQPNISQIKKPSQ